MSRKRKKKKGKSSATSRRPDDFSLASLGLRSPLSAPERPGWFDRSIKAVLDQAKTLLEARGPRELEQLTSELLGAQVYDAVHNVRRGLWFDWWFEELVEAAAAKALSESSRPDGDWESTWRLLHGLTSIGSPALRSVAQTQLGRLRTVIASRPHPDWVEHLARIAATGDVWRLRDVYGTRFGLIAGFSYPDGLDPSVFLFDIDACGRIQLASAGVFDDVDEAAAAWRELVGEAAGAAQPRPVENVEQLVCLTHFDLGDDHVVGAESQSRADNWFRALRRVHDLSDALRDRGTPLPAPKSLYRDLDTEPLVEEFTTWYEHKHGAEPDAEAVETLAGEWMEGTLPETVRSVSPHRVEYLLTLANGWIPDHPLTIATKALFPDWVLWQAEHAGLPEHLVEHVVAVANGSPRHATDCAGQIL